MPYATNADLPEHIRKMPQGKQTKWRKIFNGVYEGCDKGQDECERMAFATANDRVKKSMAELPTATVKIEMSDELKAEIEEAKKNGKYYYDESGYVYVPYGVHSIQDAVAAIEANQEIREIGKLVQIYEQVSQNLLSDKDTTDKRGALAKLSGEFSEMLAEEVEDVTDEFKAALYQTRGGRKYPRSSFLVAEGDKPSEWGLPVKNPDGTPNHRLMGAAHAALTSGFRGKKYGGPNKETALAKLKRLYKKEGMKWPEEKSVGDDFFLTIKSAGQNRVTGYAVMWGDADHKDVTGEYFDRETDGLLNIYKALGKMPLLYHHMLDDKINTDVIGVIDVMEEDEWGVWYEAQLTLADTYGARVKELFAAGKLKSSSQTASSARVVEANGHIKRWVMVEVSATPTPAEPRMIPIAELKGMYQAIGCDDFACTVKELDLGEVDGSEQGAEEARLRSLLEQERLLLEMVDY